MFRKYRENLPIASNDWTVDISDALEKVPSSNLAANLRDVAQAKPCKRRERDQVMRAICEELARIDNTCC